MPKYKVVFQRFPYGSVEHTPVVNWMLRFVDEVSKDPRFELIIPPPLDDTPITMTRNRSVEIAKSLGADYLVMIDSDTVPDVELGDDPLAKPFWSTTIDFMLKHHGPCVVGAPYCGPPPLENIYVFNWQNMESHVPGDETGGMRLGQYSREHAAILGGIQKVAALPTGMIVYDMRAFDKIPYPYFEYEYENHGPACGGCGRHKPGKETHKGSTEDVVNTRNLGAAGVPQYCNWDAWAGHRKMKTVRRPRPLTTDIVAAKMRDAVLKNQELGDRLVDIKPPANLAAEIAAAEAEYEAEKAARLNYAVDEVRSNAEKAGVPVEHYAQLFNAHEVKPLSPADLLR